jgi:hypothetical protein
MSDHPSVVSHPKIRRRTASGRSFCDRSAELGVEVVIAYEAWSASGGYIIHVNGAVDLLFEIDDWVEGARVMDPHGEDVSVAEAIDYFADRAVGSQWCRRVVWLSTSS